MITNSREILISITGRNGNDWEEKILELEKLKITRCALFIEFFNKIERGKIYSALLSSNIKEIPFVHSRDDMSKEEFTFLIDNFKTKYFNIHEIHFNQLKKLKGLHKKILIEFNYDNKIKKNVNMKRTGGFCVDLSHFKSSETRFSKEFYFIIKERNHLRKFIANHVNGYDKVKRKDMHTIKSLKDFEYLKELPNFVFGKYIAIETFNSIHEQLKFKRHISKLLEERKFFYS